MVDPGNVNIVEEAKSSTAKHPMFKQHQRMIQGDDLHMALKSCDEIGSAKTLFQFMSDL
jgi:hypothetical protein